MKDIDTLILEIPKMDPLTFIGLARLLKISVLHEDKTPRDVVEVIEEILTCFKSSNRARRREIIRMVKASNACNTLDT